VIRSWNWNLHKHGSSKEIWVVFGMTDWYIKPRWFRGRIKRAYPTRGVKERIWRGRAGGFALTRPKMIGTEEKSGANGYGCDDKIDCGPSASGKYLVPRMSVTG
jgi:hypothetical protein